MAAITTSRIQAMANFGIFLIALNLLAYEFAVNVGYSETAENLQKQNLLYISNVNIQDVAQVSEWPWSYSAVVLNLWCTCHWWYAKLYKISKSCTYANKLGV